MMNRVVIFAFVFVASMLTVASCGDDDGPTMPADAGPRTDAPTGDAGDATIDASDGAAPRDAMPDEGTPPDLSRYRISPGVYTLDGIDPELAPEDLASLDVLVADADIVGLGESIHTSGGYSEAKVRVIEHLVRDVGFRLVAFESPPAGGDVMDAYARTCAGDPEEAVRALHTIWWDQTVADLAAFLCEFNRTHADDPVRFVGFDNRQPWIDEPALREWLDRVVPTEAAELADGLSTCFGVGYADEIAFFSDPDVLAIYTGVATTGEEDHAACLAGASALSDVMQSRRDELVGASSEDEWERMRLALVRMESFDTQAYHFFGRGQGALGQSARDAAMADVLLTLRRLDHPGSRTVLWAHNYHVSRNSDTIEGVTPYRGAVNIGTLLAREPSVRYVAIGLSAYEVRIDWLDGPDQYLNDSTEAVERMLHDLGQPHLFVNFAEASAGGGTLIEPDGLHLVSSEGMIPREHYDGLLFLDVSHPPTWIGGTSPFAMLPGM